VVSQVLMDNVGQFCGQISANYESEEMMVFVAIAVATVNTI